MNYLPIEKAFELIIRRNKVEAQHVLGPIQDAMKKFDFSIIEKEPIKKKDAIHFKCNKCGFEGIQQYKNLLLYKSKCNCVIDNSKKVSKVEDILGIKKYKLLFEKSNIILDPNQNFDDKRITSEFKYKCRECDFGFTKTLDDLTIHLKQYAGCKGCEKCTENNVQVYLSLDDAFAIVFTRETKESIIPPLVQAMEKYNFSIAELVPIKSKEKIQYMCNNCHHIGSSSYYTLLRKGNCRKCNGHTGGGPKPKVITSFQDVLDIPEYKKLFDKTNYVLSDKNFETPKTISSTFYFKCKECDYEIGPNLLSYITTCLTNNPEHYGCVGCKKQSLIKTTDVCPCGKMVKFCNKCGGSGLCEHENNKYACGLGECRQKYSRYCDAHDKLITTCKECGKNYFCKHDTLKYRCRVCDYDGYISNIICSRVRFEIKKHGITKYKPSIEYLGCNVDHLINVFINYYGVNELTSDYEIDHIKPLSKFNLHDVDDIHQAFHWTNLQPLNATKNRMKSNTWGDELNEWWQHEVLLKLEMYPFKEDGSDIKTYKQYTMAPDKFKNYSTFLSSNKNLTVISTINTFKATHQFIFKCNTCDTTHTLAQTSFANKMSSFLAEDFCKVCFKEKSDKLKFEETKRDIFEATGHILLTCEFGGDRIGTYECGKCKTVNSTTYKNLFKGAGNCPSCCNNTKKNRIEDVQKQVSDLGFNLLTTKNTYTNNKNISVQCKCEKYPPFNISLSDLKKGRRKCCK
jgi:hypothetical protein